MASPGSILHSCTRVFAPVIMFIGLGIAGPLDAPPTLTADLVDISLSDGCTYDLFWNVESARQTYALYGSSTGIMDVPAAYQYPTPFGTNLGAPDPFLLQTVPGLQRDSFLTIGDIDVRFLTSVGIDFDEWSNQNGMRISDGAVFVLDPDTSPRGRIRVARLTVPEQSVFAASVQGQSYSKDPSNSDVWRARATVALQCTAH